MKSSYKKGEGAETLPPPPILGGFRKISPSHLDHDPAVLGLTLGGGVGGHRNFLALAIDDDPAVGESGTVVLAQPLLHCRGPLEGKRDIAGGVAGIVGMAGDLDQQARGNHGAVGDLLQGIDGLAGQDRGTGLEFDAPGPLADLLSNASGAIELDHFRRGAVRGLVAQIFQVGEVEDLIRGEVGGEQLGINDLDPIAEEGVDCGIGVGLPRSDTEEVEIVLEVAHFRTTEGNHIPLLIRIGHTLEILDPVGRILLLVDLGFSRAGVVQGFGVAFDLIGSLEDRIQHVLQALAIVLGPLVDDDDGGGHLGGVLLGAHDGHQTATLLSQGHIRRGPGGHTIDRNRLLGAGPDSVDDGRPLLGLVGDVEVRSFHVILGIHEVDRIGIVGGGIGVDGEAIVEGPLDHDVPVTIPDHAGDNRSLGSLGIGLPLGQAHELVLTRTEASEGDDLGLIFGADLGQFGIEAGQEGGTSITHDDTHGGALGGAGIGLVLLGELHELLLHIVAVLVVLDQEVHPVLGHEASHLGNRIPVGVGDGGLGIPAHHLDAELGAGNVGRAAGGKIHRRNGNRGIGRGGGQVDRGSGHGLGGGAGQVIVAGLQGEVAPDRKDADHGPACRFDCHLYFSRNMSRSSGGGL